MFKKVSLVGLIVWLLVIGTFGYAGKVELNCEIGDAIFRDLRLPVIGGFGHVGIYCCSQSDKNKVSIGIENPYPIQIDNSDFKYSMIQGNGICMLLGCEGQSEKHGANGMEQEVKGVGFKADSKEQKAEAKEQPEIQIKEETDISKPKLYEKKIEKKVTKIVDTIEKYCRELDKPKIDRLGIDLIMDPQLNKLLKIGTTATPILIDIIKNKEKHVYLRVTLSKFVIAEGGLNDKRIIETLIEILKDEGENKFLRGEIAWTLGRTEEVAADILLEVLKIEEDVDVRVAIINALGEKGEGEQGDKRGVEPLIKILKDENEDSGVRTRAAMSLGFIGDKRAVEPLIEVLETTKQNSIHLAGVDTLGRLKDVRAVDFLIKELRKGNMWAAEALGEIGKEVKDDRIIDALIEVILWLTSKDKVKQNSLMPRESARALGKIGDPRSIEPLIEAFKNANDLSDKRFVAGFGLSKFNDNRVIKVLEEALLDPKNDFIKEDLAKVLKELRDKK